MSAWVDRAASFGVILGVVVATSGCRKAGETGSPNTMDGGGERQNGESDPLAELDRLEGEMRAMGLSPATPAQPGDAVDASATEEKRAEEDGESDPVSPAEPAPTSATGRDTTTDLGEGSPCTNVCELSEAICDLEVRICTMAQHHADEPVYADACQRAVDDCETSGDACTECVG